MTVPIRIILNGKKAGFARVRAAVATARARGPVDVRVTWESGDVERFVAEARTDGVNRLVAGGGDGTINELVQACMGLDKDQRPEVAILPLGTANDFAGGCGISTDLDAALRLAQDGVARWIDCAIAGQKDYFLNIASAGFGAQITATTPSPLKSFLGGGAYTIAGLVRAIDFVPYHGRIVTPNGVIDNEFVVGAVCNGRQAGGGQRLAPKAMLDDGLLDVVTIANFTLEDIPFVIKDLMDDGVDGKFVRTVRVPWVEFDFDLPIPINLDGEPIQQEKIRFSIVPSSINMVLPSDCLMLS